MEKWFVLEGGQQGPILKKKKMGLQALSDLSKVQRHGKLQGYPTQFCLNI